MVNSEHQNSEYSVALETDTYYNVRKKWTVKFSANAMVWDCMTADGPDKHVKWNV